MSDWKYDIDEVGDDAPPEREPRPEIEPESPTAENALFVLLGVVLTVVAFAQVASVLQG